MILDTSYFADPLLIPGITSSLQPYDSPNGALCVNFNTVFFQKEKTGKFVSAEPQTPLLPYVLPKIKKSGLSQGRILLSSQDEECVIYAGHLFNYFLSENGVAGLGKIRVERPTNPNPGWSTPIFQGFPCPLWWKQLLEYSNNFMANQLMLTLSAHRQSPPGTLDKGVTVLTEFAKNELGIENIKLAEGSGISRGNRITAQDMAKVLRHLRLIITCCEKITTYIIKPVTLKASAPAPDTWKTKMVTSCRLSFSSIPQINQTRRSWNNSSDSPNSDLFAGGRGVNDEYQSSL